MTWLEAYKQVDKPTFTNREAAGIITFARALFRTYAKDPNVTLSPWDWYVFALPALGWAKPGDRFKVDTAHQLQPYAYSKELRSALTTIASELDAANVPFRLIVDPRGTDAVYRKLALDAWESMKALGHEASKLPGGAAPEALQAQWAAQIGPTGAAAAAASAAPIAAAAAAPKKTPVKAEPEQIPLPIEEQLEALPVGKPVATPSGGGMGGGGALLLVAALALGGGGKKKRGRR